MTSKTLARLVAAAAEEKKAREVVVLDVRTKTTIADSIEERCREHGVRPLNTAGLQDASWACIDYDSVIVHIFLPGERSFYDLEGLWGSHAGAHVSVPRG